MDFVHGDWRSSFSRSVQRLVDAASHRIDDGTITIDDEVPGVSIGHRDGSYYGKRQGALDHQRETSDGHRASVRRSHGVS